MRAANAPRAAGDGPEAAAAPLVAGATFGSTPRTQDGEGLVVSPRLPQRFRANTTVRSGSAGRCVTSVKPASRRKASISRANTAPASGGVGEQDAVAGDRQRPRLVRVDVGAVVDEPASPAERCERDSEDGRNASSSRSWRVGDVVGVNAVAGPARRSCPCALSGPIRQDAASGDTPLHHGLGDGRRLPSQCGQGAHISATPNHDAGAAGLHE